MLTGLELWEPLEVEYNYVWTDTAFYTFIGPPLHWFASRYKLWIDRSNAAVEVVVLHTGFQKTVSLNMQVPYNQYHL